MIIGQRTLTIHVIMSQGINSILDMEVLGGNVLDSIKRMGIQRVPIQRDHVAHSGSVQGVHIRRVQSTHRAEHHKG